MSIKGVARPGGYTVPRVVRSKGYCSKDPGKDAVSHDVFSDNALEHACSDGVREMRGSAKLSPPDFPGLFTAILRGARIVR